VAGSPGAALKVLRRRGLLDELARSQMTLELECIEKAQGHPLVPRLIARHESQSPEWAVFELLSPLDGTSASREAFARITGIAWPRFEFLMESYDKGVGFDQLIRSTAKNLRHLPRRQARAVEFLASLRKLIQSCGLDAGELTLIHNWGISHEGWPREGKIKLLDLGVPADTSGPWDVSWSSES
jgi:hypothetical protein